jgi:Uncharacterized protein conserved in bacteria (DUF2264)
MKKLLAFIALTVLFINVNAQSDRDYWLSIMDKMAKPLMYNLSQDKLKEVMPVELSKRTDNAVMRKAAAYLEGFARMFCGMSTWLNIEDGNEKERG